jgi:hypothetical protein
MGRWPNNIQPPSFSDCTKNAGQFGLCTSQVNVRCVIPKWVMHRFATCVRMRKRNEGTGIHLNLVWSKCRYLHKTSMLSRRSQKRDKLLIERQRRGTEDGSRDGKRLTDPVPNQSSIDLHEYDEKSMCSRYARVPDPWWQSVLFWGLAGTNQDKSLCSIVEITFNQIWTNWNKFGEHRVY